MLNISKIVCCPCFDKILSCCAANKKIVLLIGLTFLVSLSLLLFAVLTKDVCYLGIKIRGVGMFIVSISLALLIISSLFLLNNIMQENKNCLLAWILITAILWIVHIVGLIIAVIHYLQNRKAEETHEHYYSPYVKVAIFVTIEVTWFLFLGIIWKYYEKIRENIEQPDVFESK